MMRNLFILSLLLLCVTTLPVAADPPATCFPVSDDCAEVMIEILSMDFENRTTGMEALFRYATIPPSNAVLELVVWDEEYDIVQAGVYLSAMGEDFYFLLLIQPLDEQVVGYLITGSAAKKIATLLQTLETYERDLLHG